MQLLKPKRNNNKPANAVIRLIITPFLPNCNCSFIPNSLKLRINSLKNEKLLLKKALIASKISSSISFLGVTLLLFTPNCGLWKGLLPKPVNGEPPLPNGELTPPNGELPPFPNGLLLFAFPNGHIFDNRPLIIGAKVKMEVGEKVNLNF